MTWSAPWALVGLLTLPVLWWIHRRRRRPARLDLPSLMFLQDEAEATTLPRGRRFDVDLALALTAAACLALAAAGPRLLRGPDERVARVVVAGGAPAVALGYTQRVAEVVASIQAACRAGDRVEVVWEPSRSSATGRPTSAALLGAARAGRASLRIVIADRAPDVEAAGIAWIAVGDPQASNQGLVAVHVQSAQDGIDVFANVVHHGAAPARVGIQADVGAGDGPPASVRAVLDLASGGLRSAVLRLPGRPERVRLSLVQPTGGDWEDALALDDRVVLERRPLAVYVDADLPARHRDRVRAGLQASLGATGIRWVGPEAVSEAALAVRPRGRPSAAPAGWVLWLEPAPEGAAVERAAAGTDVLGRDPLVADLSTAGVDWVYAPGAGVPAPGEEVLLARLGPRAWPIVLRHDRQLRLAPDPLLGEPAPVAGPFWPLLLDNLVRAVGGQGAVGAGYRAAGLLDPAASRPGRTRAGRFEAGALRASAPTRTAPTRSLATPLVLGALACLLLLWILPALTTPALRP